MEFNILVETDILPILQKFGFEIIENSRNIVRFQSSIMKINIVLNDYDKSHFIEIGRQGEILYPLNDNAVKIIFGFELPLEQVSIDCFIHNLYLLFRTEKGVQILKGNITLLRNVIEQQSKKYTSELKRKQVLEFASKAWESNDYETFIESINKLEGSEVPQSYQLKYKIAKQKLQY